MDIDSKYKKLFLVAFGIASLIYLPTASAEEDEDFDHFSVSLGVFFTDSETKTQLDGSLGESGDEIDFEADLGLAGSDNVFRLDGYYRFNEKHRIDISVFDLSRSNTKVIDEEFEWGDTIYPIDTTLATQFDLEIYRLAYTWSFMRRDKGYLGLTAGLYIASFGINLSASGIGATESNSLTAPLPVVGLRGQYDLSEKFSLRASAELFALEYEDYDGTLFDIYAGIDYQLFEHAALGLGVNSVTLNIDVSKTSFNGNLNWRYSGGLLFFKFDF